MPRLTTHLTGDDWLVGAAQNVVPVALTAGDKIEALRQWASGRCLSADRAGVYSKKMVRERKPSASMHTRAN